MKLRDLLFADLARVLAEDDHREVRGDAGAVDHARDLALLHDADPGPASRRAGSSWQTPSPDSDLTGVLERFGQA